MSEVTAPVVTHWANTMAWIMGKTQGRLSFEVS
jgi:hypothetical protein